MTKITEEQIKIVLEKHLLWINRKPEGEKANLSGANLSRASLSGANLCGAKLIGAKGIVAPAAGRADRQPTNTIIKVTREQAQILLTNIEYLKILAEGGQIQAKLEDSWVNTETPNLANYGPEMFRVRPEPEDFWMIVPKHKRSIGLLRTKTQAEDALRDCSRPGEFRVAHLKEVED